MSELDGPVTRTLLGIRRDGGDDRALAEQICRACVAGLEIDGASISLVAGSTASETLWASDATAKLLEDLQFALGEGTCIEAATSGRPVFAPYLHETAEVAPWPAFAAAVLDQSAARAIVALPLRWGAIHLGVLNLYSRTQGSLSPNQRSDAMSAADIATLMMLGVRTDPGDGHWLDPSLRNRAEIHQATGMVLVQLGVSLTEALARIRAHAVAEQLTLSDVAKDVVARRLSFTPDPTRGSAQ